MEEINLQKIELKPFQTLMQVEVAIDEQTHSVWSWVSFHLFYLSFLLNAIKVIFIAQKWGFDEFASEPFEKNETL